MNTSNIWPELDRRADLFPAVSVLLVEDDTNQLESLVRWIRRLLEPAYNLAELVEAENARDAREELEARQKRFAPFDITILDWQLPVSRTNRTKEMDLSLARNIMEQIKTPSPSTRLLVQYSHFADMDDIKKMWEEINADYVGKDQIPGHLVPKSDSGESKLLADLILGFLQYEEFVVPMRKPWFPVVAGIHDGVIVRSEPGQCGTFDLAYFCYRLGMLWPRLIDQGVKDLARQFFDIEETPVGGVHIYTR